ncbi:DEAD/DEAH box helicase family protein [Clostridioides difficile]|uniref:EcoAI/FtnUII family type I restriction enzme subunit R n=1 Tax=Clostridioides difficile TaxID=1496 RepID=UPI0014311B68|nr:DEAD/DEAH box helicase family protein [Clostridioides difficile]EGT5419401.1 restriction endonuclease subunit R [Clostridioides difficile]MBH7487560.1 DEAD/DEAH box helicase family protein [Clostridioides difficile]MBY1671027.1 DEAD/DEAH box helicase family protein [Clostridioides difficile]MBY1793111.1 DEAD/DEAH box helicase family protein [Clostridioides difficile]MBY1996231.1 DEAD/DEAH box helicase family protein [Clostridioides difficile]
MTKKDMSERDICTKYITPALVEAGWDIKRQIREEVTFTDGRVIVRGKVTTRGKKKRADYILYHKSNLPIAVVEAKDNKHSIGDGMQQAINYADILDLQFAYSSNGDGFIEHDMKNGTEKEISLEKFPSPEELWNRYKGIKGITPAQEEIITEPYYFALGDKIPRYYQIIAVNRTIEAVAKGQDRILLVMATGTGKTYTAFQIMYRLRSSGTKKKILFVADRNILVDQAIQNDFKPFQKVMIKVEDRKMDSSYEVFLALYQQLSGAEDLEVFKQFSPDFFDLIIIDECHRGSAKDTSAWRKILDYFSSATQVGLTATPKETKEISNSAYFGEPIYTYSLKQGIEDGFLAPYKVIRIGLDKDLEGYRPIKGKLDDYGNELEDREYNIKDFDKNLIIDDRTKVVAKKVTEFLKKTDRFSKTIVFCIDIEHAERMRRALINENSDLVAENHKYVMRITGDNKEGKAQLDNFIDEDSKYPTIVTTSKLLTTGVDCKTCKLIVLENNIASMTEFKQIIGRGARLKPDYGKEYFTIIDFRNVSRLFADPDFNGEPVVIYEPEEGEDITPPEPDNTDEDDEIKEEHTKYRVSDVKVKVISERVQYYDKDGKLITESLKDYSKKNIKEKFEDLDAFLRKWNSEDKKQAIIDELVEHGALLDALREEIGNPDIDDFDLICHVAYDKKPLTRSERANNVKKRGYLYKYSDTAQKVLESLLEKYSSDKSIDLKDTKVLELKPFDEFGNPLKIVKAFGGKKKYIEAIKELEKEIYV